MSRKLICSVAGMTAVVVVYALAATHTVDKETTAIAIAAVVGLAAWLVDRQAKLDEKGCEK